MVDRCAAALMTASPSDSVNASANRIHRADARVRRMWASYNDFASGVGRPPKESAALYLVTAFKNR